uniref:Si:ch73-30l9.1 n=1 Tax=Nothobranchius rachovii TaxID=451742 RepID=A0A1A8SKH0_9TELE
MNNNGKTATSRGMFESRQEETEADEMETPMEPLFAFLSQRNLSEECISAMRRDKIDVSAIASMDDNSLATYIPIYGDRIATRRFCSEYQRKGERDVQRQVLLQKLRRKMGIDKYQEESDQEESYSTRKHSKAYLRNNKLAVRKTRKVELGWIHEGKQQRKKNGGGTRRVDVPKEAKKSDILSVAKELFFPNGQSKKGKLEDFTCNILDYQEDDILEEDMTVGELYSLLKMGILRFYLCTKERKELTITELINVPDERVENDEPEDKNNFSESSNSSEVMVGPYTGEPQAWQLADTLPLSSDDEGESVSFNLPSTSQNFVSPVNQSLSNNSAPSTSTPTENPASPDMGPVFVLSSLSNDEGNFVILGQPSSAHNLANPNSQPLTINTLPSTSSLTEQPTHTFMLPAPNVSSSVSEAHSNTELSGFEVVNVSIKLHRTKLMDELITQFKDPNILTYPLKFTFIDEKGADADGISRDVYSAFWTEFLDCLAEGQDMRVPLLTPKWQEEEWKSVGRILVKEERDLVNKALLDDLLGDEHDELIDLLDRMGAKSIPTRENLKAVLLNVAHKLIIQQPKYALDKMSQVARTTFAHAFRSQLNIVEMYENMKPTARKVLKLFEASPATQAESQSLRYLQQYVRGLDQAGLRKFLRFTTGSDVLCIKNIEVLFTSLDGVARRPVAHTCGPVLELPWTYLSFPELRVEFDSILSSQRCFDMDIV